MWACPASKSAAGRRFGDGAERRLLRRGRTPDGERHRSSRGRSAGVGRGASPSGPNARTCVKAGGEVAGGETAERAQRHYRRYRRQHDANHREGDTERDRDRSVVVGDLCFHHGRIHVPHAQIGKLNDTSVATVTEIDFCTILFDERPRWAVSPSNARSIDRGLRRSLPPSDGHLPGRFNFRIGRLRPPRRPSGRRRSGRSGRRSIVPWSGRRHGADDGPRSGHAPFDRLPDSSRSGRQRTRSGGSPGLCVGRRFRRI